MIRGFASAVLIYIAAVVWPTPILADEQPSYWNTTDWYVVLKRDDDGQVVGFFYERDHNLPGYLLAIDEGFSGRLILYWVPFPRSDEPPARVCTEKKFGRDHWGLAVIAPNGADRFSGYRAECGDPVSTGMHFDGILVGGQPWWIASSEPVPELRRPELDVARHQAIAASNAATSNRVPDSNFQELMLDYDCDGARDYVLGWLDSNSSGDPVYELTITRWPARPGNERPELHALSYTIPFEPNDRAYLCAAEGQSAGITLQELNTSDPNEHGSTNGSAHCRSAIAVSNGVCPSAVYYWSPQSRASVATMLE